MELCVHVVALLDIIHKCSYHRSAYQIFIHDVINTCIELFRAVLLPAQQINKA